MVLLQKVIKLIICIVGCIVGLLSATQRHPFRIGLELDLLAGQAEDRAFPQLYRDARNKFFRGRVHKKRAIPGIVVGVFVNDGKSGRNLGAQAFAGMTLEEAVRKAEREFPSPYGE